MNARVIRFIGIAAVLGLVAGAVILLAPGQAAQEAASDVVADETEADQEGFARITGPREFNAPQDYGPHPDFQTEWWYYTGNLEAEDGRQFGYQLTFFRRALEPAEERVDRDSAWAADQIYLGHFAVTNAAANDYRSFERYARGAAGIAGAQAGPYNVWLEDWEAVEVRPGARRLRAASGGVSIDLDAEITKGPIFQGIDGYSQKGDDPGNASFYYSFTQMETTGTITVEGTVYDVSGLSWMDHEFSTSALGENQIGWDWFSLQLSDDTELMLYNIRERDGGIYPESDGVFVNEESETTLLALNEYSIDSTDTWRSPDSGGVYPSGWEVTVDTGDREINLVVEPLIEDQEFDASFVYWEGAVRVTGESNGQPVAGYGYVELTGYADGQSLEDTL